MFQQIDISHPDCQRIWAAKAWLAGRGLSQRIVAGKMGVDVSAVNKVVLGHRRTRSVIEYLTKTLGMPSHLLPEPLPSKKQKS